jgi:hypothetical protein
MQASVTSRVDFRKPEVVALYPQAPETKENGIMLQISYSRLY